MPKDHEVIAKNRNLWMNRQEKSKKDGGIVRIFHQFRPAGSW